MWLWLVLLKQDLVLHFPVMQVLRQSLVARSSAIARSASDEILSALYKQEMFQKGYLIWSWSKIGVIAVGYKHWKTTVGPWSFWWVGQLLFWRVSLRLHF